MHGQSVRSLTRAAVRPEDSGGGNARRAFTAAGTMAKQWELISPEGSRGDSRGRVARHRPGGPEHHLCGHVASAVEDDGRRRALDRTSSRASSMTRTCSRSSSIRTSRTWCMLSACSGIYKSEERGQKFTGGVTSTRRREFRLGAQDTEADAGSGEPEHGLRGHDGGAVPVDGRRHDVGADDRRRRDRE